VIIKDDLLSPGYDQADEVRWVTEAAKRSDRTAFARDRARILHSAGLRRLAAKTQVLVAGSADFPRTRLTHTLEVAQIGRELGSSLSCDPDLVEVGCLAHDLGHPPFGHNGEDALNEIAKDAGGFEGNAQTLRVLTRLESKTFDADGFSVGLNLTRAGLDSAIKYPWSREINSFKFGYFADDKKIFDWAREGAIADRKCFEAQVMDWADDVAYSVHDVEDAVVGGHLSLAVLAGGADREAIAELAASTYIDAETHEIFEAMDRLSQLQYWPGVFDGSQQSLAALKNTTSQLIGRFCGAAQTETRKLFGPGYLTRYNASLMIPRGVEVEVAVLKTLANLFVMQRSGATEIYAQQQDTLKALATVLYAREGRDIETWLKPAWDRATTDGQRLRVVVDQIASLTDSSAVAWHQRLCTRN
jgi:dGTPase